ncbi:CBS domain-containing protein [Pseudonocardia saturnea]
MRQTTVRDVMTTGVLSVGPDAAFTEVARVLSTGAVRAVPVLDQEGRLLGVVSEADLLATAEPRQDRPWWRHRPRHTHRTGPQAKVGAGTARELMSAPAVTVGPSTTVARAARTMREHGLTWMPVVGPDGRVVGVLGRSDLLAVFLRSDAEIRTEVVDEVLGRMLLVDPTGISVEASDGVVTLSGEIDTRTDAILAVRFVERMEGVVEVVDRLRHRVDDRVATLPIDPLY